MLSPKEIDDYVRSEECQSHAIDQCAMVLASSGISEKDWDALTGTKISSAIFQFSMMTASMCNDHVHSVKLIAELRAENKQLRETLEMLK